jgi:hypothetical protein
MTVDGRPFMILRLEPEDGRYAGTLTRPRQMTSDGRNFSGISKATTTERVTTDAPHQRTLRFESTAEKDPNDKQEYELSVTTADEARLKMVDAPFEPWSFTRHSDGGTPKVWSGWDPKRSYPLEEPYVEPNSEMAEIYRADQAVRQSLESFKANAKQIERDDSLRRERTRALLATGELRAGEDFRLAAMVFQHGSEPRDYLFAHTLALVALEKGDRSASWIAAASLDRYLTSIGQRQIFGAQFSLDGATQPPFDTELVSDALRRELGVPALADQHAQMRKLLRR